MIPQQLKQSIALCITEQYALNLLEQAAQEIMQGFTPQAHALLNEADDALMKMPASDQERIKAYFFELIKNTQ